MKILSLALKRVSWPLVTFASIRFDPQGGVPRGGSKSDRGRDWGGTPPRGGYPPYPAFGYRQTPLWLPPNMVIHPLGCNGISRGARIPYVFYPQNALSLALKMVLWAQFYVVGPPRGGSPPPGGSVFNGFEPIFTLSMGAKTRYGPPVCYGRGFPLTTPPRHTPSGDCHLGESAVFEVGFDVFFDV